MNRTHFDQCWPPPDTFASVERSTHGISVADITRLYAFDKDDGTTMRRVVEVEALPESW